MDITHVKQKLASNAQGVAEYLLPQGRKEAAEWRAGSIGGEKGQSLGVRLTGPKAGVWADFSTGESGDLIDLWVAARKVPLSAALEEARHWLGIERQKPYREPQKTYRRPAKPVCSVPRGVVRDYLTEVRNIPDAILTRYKIGERGDMIVFPFMLPDGEVALVKVRKAVDGAKPKPTETECEPILFGWQAIHPDSRVVVLTEGEIDCLSLAAYGWPAMSVPFGGGKGNKQQWIENEFDRMERFEKIYLAMDMDKQGDEAAEEIANRLGRHRCYRVALPKKDANECLVAGVSKDIINAAIHGAVSLDPEGLRKASHFTDAVIHLFWPAEGQHVGYRTPYGKLGDRLLFRPAEVTLWSGASGAGKSQILSDCAVDWIKQGSRICLSSLEMRASHTLKRMCKQASGIDRPTAKHIGDVLLWLDGGLLLYEFVGKASVKSLIDVFSYARMKYGCDQFVIDSLMRLGVASDDYTGQEKAMFQIVEWAVSNAAHLHLVAHSRKGGSDAGAPETEDVKGASEIGANAFNIITVWRHRQLEDDIRKLEMAGASEQQLAPYKEQPGVLMNIAKQRNGDFEGKVGLWFDQSTYRYYSSHERGLWSREYIHQKVVKNVA